jgi:hypothetical protein
LDVGRTLKCLQEKPRRCALDPLPSVSLRTLGLGRFAAYIFAPQVYILLLGLDFDLLVLDVETKTVVYAHVLIGNPDEGEEGDKVSAPIDIKQLEAGDDEE